MAQAFASIASVDDARNAVDIHCAWSWPSPNAPIIAGSATFTVVAASMVAIEPISIVRSRNHR